MSSLNSVAIVGLGALGILYGNLFRQLLPAGALRFVANTERQARYTKEGIFCNGSPCSFHFVSPEETNPADLVVFAVKATGLQQAIADARNQVGKETIIISLLNGITSEQILSEAFGREKVLYCIAQGMDAVRKGHSLIYQHTGELILGYPADQPEQESKLQAVLTFLNEAGISCRKADNIMHMLYCKWMLNVGVNQVVTLYKGTYGTVQAPSEARDMMFSAMTEAMLVAQAEGIPVTEEDRAFYMHLVNTLSPEGMPSMRQDALAGRATEVEFFAGTVITKAKQLGISTPTNQMLYAALKN